MIGVSISAPKSLRLNVNFRFESGHFALVHSWAHAKELKGEGDRLADTTQGELAVKCVFVVVFA